MDKGETPHWSKNGSKIITSSPGSMKAMKALNMPSFAPVVMVTSVLAFTSRPRKGEYASAIALFNLGRPLIYSQLIIMQLLR